MDETCSQETLLTATAGDVQIRSFCRPKEIRHFTFDRQFTSPSLYTSRELLEKSADRPDTNVVLALADRRHIIGYGVLAYPAPGERWADLGPQMMREVQAIEVCRSWRACGIAAAMLKMMVAAPRVEEQVVYMVGYSWTWDLQGTGKTAQEYQQMLIELFKPHGFQPFHTNEPNICLKPENIFMGRVGRQIKPLMLDRFKWLRFGLAPWLWRVDGH